jgi:hypothetical protein
MQSSFAHHTPQYTAQALCAREKRAVVLPHAFGLRSIVAGWTWCASSTASAAAARTATTTTHSPTHRRLRQALRRQRCTARPLFTRPAWPRSALRPHDHQRAPRKLIVHAVALCSPCAYHDHECSSKRSSDYCCGLYFDAYAVRPPPSRMLPVF